MSKKIDLVNVYKKIAMLIDKAESPAIIDSTVVNAFSVYLYSEWAKLAKKVIAESSTIKKTEGSVNAFLKNADSIMGGYSNIVKNDIRDYVEFLYKFSKDKFIKQKKLSLIKKAKLPTITPSIWLQADEDAIAQIEAIVYGSAGKFYKGSVQKTIYESVKRNIFESNLTPEEATVVIKEDLQKALRIKPGALESDVVPYGFSGTADAYFKGMAEYASSLSRTASHLYTMKEVEVKTITVFSIRSNRTCIGCLAMDGKTYKMGDASGHMDKILNVDDVSELKTLQPSFSFKSISDYSAESLAAKMAEAKATADSQIQLPPFHFRCECYVDMG